MTLRIQCWSGPRNVSTAFMYSWAQRSDTTVVDEPLYAHYLSRFDRDHPMTAEVLASQSCNVDEVVNDIILASCATPVLFIKQMAHHLRETDTEFLAETENILLTRDPADMLTSLSNQLPNCDLDDTGLPEQIEILEAILEQGGSPIVIDSKTLLTDPADVLTQLCGRLKLDFEPEMLAWPTGPRSFDGVWAPAWYEGVHRSSGFAPYQPKTIQTPDRLRAILEQAAPLYQRLAEFGVGE